jgi:hypothetical protein
MSYESSPSALRKQAPLNTSMLHRAPQNNPFCPFPPLHHPAPKSKLSAKRKAERESNEEMVQWVERIYFFTAGENSI